VHSHYENSTDISFSTATDRIEAAHTSNRILASHPWSPFCCAFSATQLAAVVAGLSKRRTRHHMERIIDYLYLSLMVRMDYQRLQRPVAKCKSTHGI